MDVEVTEQDGEACTLELRERPALYRIAITEHGLRDIEFELARRRAMGRCCHAVNGQHTCALAPQHGEASHLCRGCTATWPVTA